MSDLFALAKQTDDLDDERIKMTWYTSQIAGDRQNVIKHVEYIVGVLQRMKTIHDAIINHVNVQRSNLTNRLSKVRDVKEKALLNATMVAMDTMMGSSMQFRVITTHDFELFTDIKSVVSGTMGLKDLIQRGRMRLQQVGATLKLPPCPKHKDFFNNINEGTNVPSLCALITQYLAHSCYTVGSNGLLCIDDNTRPAGPRVTIKTGQTPEADKCPSCGGSVEMDMCMGCGAKICPQCGTANESLSRCSQCGKYL